MKIFSTPAAIVCSLTIILVSCSGKDKKTEELGENPIELQKDEVPPEFRNIEVGEVIQESEPEKKEPDSKKDSGVANKEAKKEEPKPKKKPKKVAKKKKPKPSKFKYPDRRPSWTPIWLGEKMTFDVTYIGIPAGEFTLSVPSIKEVKDRPTYYIFGRAVSSAVLNLFYRLDDSIQSFFDVEGLFSHRFELELNESKQFRKTLELYDSEKKKTFYWNKQKHKEKGDKDEKKVSPIKPFSQDSISALYYLRHLKLPPKGVVTFPVVSEGKLWEAHVTVIRREYMNTPLGRVRTVMVKPETKFKGVLKKQGNSYIWFTDDDRRFITRVEAKVKIGTIKASLTGVKKGTPPSQSAPPLASQ